MSTFYEDLGIQMDATGKEIKAAFRKLASKFHPDKETGDVEEFQKVQRAYMVLSDADRKDKYDKDGDTGADYEPTVRDRALQNLSVLFSSIIEANLRCLETVDLIATIVARITDNRAFPIDLIKKANKRLGRIDEAISRLTNKKPDAPLDLFGNVLNQERGDILRTIKHNEGELEMMDIMEAVTCGYDYRHDKRGSMYENPYDPLNSVRIEQSAYKPGKSTPDGPSNRTNPYR
jgi:curved DNA-binding protein CbpA